MELHGSSPQVNGIGFHCALIGKQVIKDSRKQLLFLRVMKYDLRSLADVTSKLC
jgi:hypothetical protein